jgi:hypothetical protein
LSSAEFEKLSRGSVRLSSQQNARGVARAQFAEWSVMEFVWQTHLERFGVLLMALEELSVKTFGGPFATLVILMVTAHQRGER